MAEETFDERTERGRNLDPDAGQAQVQAKMDIEHALGYVPSEGATLGGDEDLDPEQLAEQQAEANKQFTMPPDGLAAEPVPPYSAEATSSEGSEEGGGSGNGMPAESASRAEWDAYAESQGDDPSQFATKQDLIDYYKS
jgi:hypothetical protein